MPPTLTEAQALALITDHSSRYRGPELAEPTHWANLGADELSLWGEYQGSGKKPYQMAAGLLEAASKCSCPSPDTPCKHAAGLLLLYVKHPELFTAPAPDKLAPWRRARQQHAERLARRGQPRDPALAAAAQARLIEGVDVKRLARMVAGAAELATVLEDAVQQGLTIPQLQQADFWESQAQRAVDNQLPALASVLHELPELAAQPAPLLARLGELYLLLRAVQNLPNLPPVARQEVLQQVGVTFRREDLLDAYEPVTDDWLVLGYAEGGERNKWGHLNSPNRRTWLYGPATGRYAMLYDFAFGSERLPDALVLGTQQAGKLVYYPGLLPLRAAPEQLGSPVASYWRAAPPGLSIGQLLAGYATALGQAPWLRQWPVTLSGVRAARLADGRRALHHPAENLTIPLFDAGRYIIRYNWEQERDDRWWDLLGNSLEQPCTVFGEWDGRALRLLHSWPNSQPAAARHPSRGATAPTGNGYGPPWPTLLQVATVGPHTMPLPALPGLPPATTPAQQLLLAAGTAALLQKTGYESPPNAQLVQPDGPAETWAPLGPTGTDILHELLTNPTHIDLVAYCLRRLGEHQRRLPSVLLVPLLLQDYLYKESYAFQPLKLHHYLLALGQTGTWLMRQHKDWRLRLQPAPDSSREWQPGDAAPILNMKSLEVWAEEDRPAASNYLRWLRHTNPEAARQQLAEALTALDQHYNAPHLQQQFLAACAHHLTPAEAAILEPYLQRPGKSYYHTQLHITVREILLRVPGSTLLERIWARAAPLLTLHRPTDGPPTLQITLPPKWTVSWKADGITSPGKGQPEEGGKQGELLWQLLALLPPRRWAEHLTINILDLLTLAQAHEWGPRLSLAWHYADKLYPDREVTEARIILDQWQLSRQFSRFYYYAYKSALKALSYAEQLDFARRYLPPQPKPPYLLLLQLAALADFPDTPWPADLAKALLTSLTTELLSAVTADSNDLPGSWLTAISHLIGGTSSVPEELLPTYAQALASLPARFPLAAEALQRMVEGIDFRQRLLASLANPAA